MVLMLIFLAIFAEFFSARRSIYKIDLQSAFMPPQQVHFIDTDGKFHLVPFVYKVENTLDPKTFQVIWAENTEKMYQLKFFVTSWPYKLLGLIPNQPAPDMGWRKAAFSTCWARIRWAAICGAKPVKPGASP